MEKFSLKTIFWAVIAVLVFLFTSGWAKWTILCLLVIAALIYFGEEKCQKWLQKLFRKGKENLETAASPNVDEELTIRDVACNPVGENKYQIEIVTEKGLSKFRPQAFNVIPAVLKKGTKIRHRVIYTIDKLKKTKEETFVVADSEGVDRIFYVED